jgi:hypothetical protein
LGVAATVILGLLFTLAATFVSTALLVRTGFGRKAHPITLLPAPLVLYGLWMSAWFVFENVRQFLLTAISPGTGLRLVAFVFLAASLLLVAFVYGCVSVVHQLLGSRASRIIRRVARVVAPAFAALLIMGWSGYHFNGDTALLTLLRRILGYAAIPLALAAWVWLLIGARGIADATWRARVITLARAYVALFALVALASAVRDRLAAVTPPLPLIVDVAAVLAYTLITVLWVESVERIDRPAGSVPRA